jgi:hypothetical protein
MIKVCSEYGYVKKAFKFYNVLKKIGLTPKKGTFFWLLQVQTQTQTQKLKLIPSYVHTHTCLIESY